MPDAVTPDALFLPPTRVVDITGALDVAVQDGCTEV